MNFADYVNEQQSVDFEVEKDGRRIKLGARIQHIEQEQLDIVLEDTESGAGLIVSGIKGIVWGKKRGLRYSLYVEVDAITGEGNLRLLHIPARAHLRVDAYLLLRYHVLSEPEFLSRKNKYIQTMSRDSEDFLFAPDRFLADERDSAALSPELLSEIRGIHRKLDYIISLIEEKKDQKTIFHDEPTEVNISGSGMRFQSTEIFNTGVFLDIELVLPIGSGMLIQLLGQVVRCAPVEDADSVAPETANEVAIRFAAINEDDREFIIKYVFKRQRELLRAEDDTACAQ